MDIKITLPDGSNRRVPQYTTIAEIAESISISLRKQAVAGKLNGRLVDLQAELAQDGALEIVTLDSADGLAVYRHSAAHVLAQALKRIYGEAKVKLGIGPVIQDGFYYDIDMEHSLTPEDLQAIEAEMSAIVRENLPIVRRIVSRSEALAFFNWREESLKVELINELPKDAVITMYEQGEFSDLCRGPHLPSTGKLKAFKLLSVAGAYWRGNAENRMLQRIYGTAFVKPAELEEHLRMLEEAKQRDHRKLGKELELFMFSEEAPGMPFYLPKGMLIRTELENFARRLQRERDYEEVRTPQMMNNRLWEQSGHYDHYKDNMYFTMVDDVKYSLKPMNCPGHILVYKNSLHSYRELPIRIAEFGQVHRHEFSGALSGMMRVRTFCQDDAHLFVLPEQIGEEIGKVIEMIDHIYKVFGFEYQVELSTRPDDFMGDVELWNEAESSLQKVLEARGIPYRLNAGDGAFYGPKIDFHILDALKRSWQCGTIQLDFQMPEKFEMNYIGEDGQKHRPVMIHRAVYGAIDRFMGILIEHFAGAFPLWLAPVQVKLLPVSANYTDDALQVKETLKQAGIRVDVDVRNEKLGLKIRDGELEKVPYLLVIGEQERQSSSVSVRKRGAGDLGRIDVAALIQQIFAEVKAGQELAED
ncbi:threonine--tRNA ligase [Paenibacillus sp. NFR01]|uniref:threonine--tRNA ligase n=1 Tax=Paenibacillus sp. NFR01 TaxID=1566279 RepID=UPI0008AE0DA9|nr:threonine--tRNA ligase [Paenibacillus sp. NFR01]SET18836.1 threonyl-tRNA synthetase [Paenibacillus sp. NFR01]